MRKLTLKILFIITLLYEVVLIFLTYQVVGDERLTTQLIRLGIELVLFLVLITGKSNLAMYLLIGYNLFSLVVAYGRVDSDSIYWLPIIVHSITIFGVYLNEWIDERLAKQIKPKNIED